MEKIEKMEKEKLERIFKLIDRENKIILNDQLDYFYKTEAWTEIVANEEKANIKEEGLEDDLDYLEDLKFAYECQLTDYFKENIELERIEKIKNIVEEKGYTFFAIEVEEYFKEDYKDSLVYYTSNDIEKALEDFKDAMYYNQLEANTPGVNRHYRVMLTACLDGDVENMDVLIEQEIKKN